MIVKAIYNPNFGDKTTGETYETQIKRCPGDIFECDDELAEERIKGGFVKKATAKEIKEYEKQQEEMKKQLEKEKDENDDKDKDINENNNIIKTLEKCTIEELIEISEKENIELKYPKDDTAKDVIIETIIKVREERSNDENDGNKSN